MRRLFIGIILNVTLITGAVASDQTATAVNSYANIYNIVGSKMADEHFFNEYDSLTDTVVRFHLLGLLSMEFVVKEALFREIMAKKAQVDIPESLYSRGASVRLLKEGDNIAFSWSNMNRHPETAVHGIGLFFDNNNINGNDLYPSIRELWLSLFYKASLLTRFHDGVDLNLPDFSDLSVDQLGAAYIVMSKVRNDARSMIVSNLLSAYYKVYPHLERWMLKEPVKRKPDHAFDELTVTRECGYELLVEDGREDAEKCSLLVARYLFLESFFVISIARNMDPAFFERNIADNALKSFLNGLLMETTLPVGSQNLDQLLQSAANDMSGIAQKPLKIALDESQWLSKHRWFFEHMAEQGQKSILAMYLKVIGIYFESKEKMLNNSLLIKGLTSGPIRMFKRHLTLIIGSESGTFSMEVNAQDLELLGKNLEPVLEEHQVSSFHLLKSIKEHLELTCAEDYVEQSIVDEKDSTDYFEGLTTAAIIETYENLKPEAFKAWQIIHAAIREALNVTYKGWNEPLVAPEVCQGIEFIFENEFEMKRCKNAFDEPWARVLATYHCERLNHIIRTASIVDPKYDLNFNMRNLLLGVMKKSFADSKHLKPPAAFKEHPAVKQNVTRPNMNEKVPSNPTKEKLQKKLAARKKDEPVVAGPPAAIVLPKNTVEESPVVVAPREMTDAEKQLKEIETLKKRAQLVGLFQERLKEVQKTVAEQAQTLAVKEKEKADLQGVVEDLTKAQQKKSAKEKNMRDELQAVKKQSKLTAEKLVELTEAHKVALEKVSVLTEEKSNVAEAMVECQHKIDSLSRELALAQQGNMSLINAIEGLERQGSALKQEVENAWKVNMQTAEKARAQMEQAKRTKENLERENESLRSELENKRVDVSILEEYIEECESDALAKENRLAQLTHEALAHEEKYAQLAKQEEDANLNWNVVFAKNCILEQRLIDKGLAEEEKNVVCQENDRLKAENEILRAQLMAMQDAVDVPQDNSRLLARIMKLEQKVEKKSADLQDAKRTIRSLHDLNDGLRGKTSNQ